MRFKQTGGGVFERSPRGLGLWLVVVTIGMGSPYSCRSERNELASRVNLICFEFQNNVESAISNIERGDFETDQAGNVTGWWFGPAIGFDVEARVRRTTDLCLDARTLPGGRAQRTMLRAESRRWTDRLEPDELGTMPPDQLRSTLQGLLSHLIAIDEYPYSDPEPLLQSVVLDFCTDYGRWLEERASLLEEQDQTGQGPSYQLSLGGAVAIKIDARVCRPAGSLFETDEAEIYMDATRELMDPLIQSSESLRELSHHDQAAILRSLAELVAETNRLRSERR